MPINIDAIKAHHGAVAKDGEVRIKAATIKTPTIDRDQRLVKGLVSVAVPDLDNEVVVPSGLDTSYFPEKVKAVYFSHNYGELPVGTCRAMSVKDSGRSLYAATYILPGARGDDLLTAMEHEAINGFSVGFMPVEYGPPTPEETKAYGLHDCIVRKGLLLEYSVTPMPCNPDALVELVSKSLIHRSSAVAFGLPDTPERKVFAVTERRVLVPKRVLRRGA
jgi:HK97 family phage prohead protease